VLLEEALQRVKYPVLRSISFDAKPADLIRAAKELDIEGIIAKRKGSGYEPGKGSGAWLKYKSRSHKSYLLALAHAYLSGFCDTARRYGRVPDSTPLTIHF
jgi:ATP-dependent DNA ligase